MTKSHERVRRYHLPLIALGPFQIIGINMA